MDKEKVKEALKKKFCMRIYKEYKQFQDQELVSTDLFSCPTTYPKGLPPTISKSCSSCEFIEKMFKEME